MSEPNADGFQFIQERHLKEFTAIWDTGATNSVVTQAVIDACGLKQIGVAEVVGTHGTQRCETFLVNIGLPNKVMVPNIQVTRGDLPGGEGGDVLIGMDIIGSGDFAVTSKGGVTMFTFRMPSVASIDFVEEARALDAMREQRRRTTKPKRPGKTFGRKK